MKKFLPLFFLFIVQDLYSQTVLENNPPSLDWYQVNTPHFRVLFPEGFNVQAQRVANTLEHIHKVEAKSLGSKPRKISVILQNQSTESNGFVSILPRRSEFYTMPSQNYNFIGSNDWLNLLASHEYRHIVQYQHSIRGFNKFVYYLFGAPSLAGLAQVSAPDWFWEGDAVATETAFTPGGRGRIPNFSLLFRTNLLEGRTFNYHKQYLRSYKHNIPNHYVLGYHMVSYLRRRSDDPNIWGKISARSWSVPFIPFAFSNAIKNKANLYVTQLYNEMAEDLKKEWQTELQNLTLTPSETIHERSTKAYTDYLYPQPLADGSVLVMKRGIGDIEQFVKLKQGEEEKIFTPGLVNESGMLSSENDIVIWNEFGFDPRWRVRNYSLIKAYDMKEEKQMQVTDKNTRYGSAALSPDGKHIVTIRTDVNYKHNIIILSFPDGRVEQEVANPENFFYAMPRWSSDGRIAVLKTTPAGKTITIINTKTLEAEDVLPVSHENVGHPLLFNHFLFFNSPVSGIDNIYVLDLKNKKRYQVTSSKYGAYNPAVSADGKTIFYNDQGRNGMDVVKVNFDVDTWKEYKVEAEAKTFYQHLVEQEGRPNLFDSIPQTQLSVRPYSRLKGFLNPYSWGAFFNEDLTRVDVGLTSRDILSTTAINAGYVYDLNERTGFWRVGATYQGWYPIIDINFTQGKRSVDEGNIPTLIVSGQDSTEVVNEVVFEWEEQNLEAGLRIPLITTRSKYISNLDIGNAVGITRVKNFKNNFNNERFFPALIRNDSVISAYPFLDYVGNGNIVYNHFNFSAERFLKTSRRDINSKWAQTLSIDYYNTPYGGDLNGGLFSVLTYLYFPGLAKHHSFFGYGAYQHTQISENRTQESKDYIFRSVVPEPRGLDVALFEDLYATSANYTFPVWYPDIALGPILNIQRVRANSFLDYAVGYSRLFNEENIEYASVGGELKFDINILRFLPQLDIGVRYAYGLTHTVSKFEILIGTFNF